MPKKTLTRGTDGSWKSTAKALPSEAEQQKKVVKASDFLKEPTKSTKKPAESASK